MEKFTVYTLSFSCMRNFSLLAKIKVYVLHIWTQLAWGMMGPYARAYCFFANLGKKFRIGLGGFPCPSVGGYLTGCTACTNAQGTPTGVLYVFHHQRRVSTAGTRPGNLKREYSRNPAWDPPKESWGTVLWHDSYLAEGDWGRYGVEIRALKLWRF